MRTQPVPSLSRKLLVYGVSAGAAAATAHADPVVTAVGETSSDFYFNLQNTVPVSTSDSTGEEFYVVNNFFKQGYVNGLDAGSVVETQSRLGGSDGTTPTDYALELGVGTTIGAGTFTTTGELNNYLAGAGSYSGSDAGDWNPPTRGFLGFTIMVDGQADYGYADLTVTQLDDDNGLELTLNGYAYDPSGAPIVTEFIPEPGSTTTLLVAGAAGAAGLAIRRRHRQAAAALAV